MSNGPDPAPDEEFDFVHKSLSCIIDVATQFDPRRLFLASELASKLRSARIAVESASHQPRQYQERLGELRSHLEMLCEWTEPPGAQQDILQALVEPRTYQSDEETKCRISRSIFAWMIEPRCICAKYLERLDELSSFSTTPIIGIGRQTGVNAAYNKEDYPAHVNSSLYSVLKAHSMCICDFKEHPTRLRLRGNVVSEEGCAVFDLLLSSSPETWDYWQDLELRVSLKTIHKKPGDLSGTAGDPWPRRFKLLSRDALCNLAVSRLECRISCQVQNGELHQLFDGLPIVQQVQPAPSLSLRRILQTHQLTGRMKLVLAYIVSRSFWQFYDSPWMDTMWTCDDIHFLSEPGPTDNYTNVESRSFYASKPYFAVRFDSKSSFPEYCNSLGVIHRFPRVLALSVLLLEIATESCLTLEDHGSMVRNLNMMWKLIKARGQDIKPLAECHNFHPEAHKVIVNCLNKHSFYHGPTTSDPESEIAKKVRKSAVYNITVRPFEVLLNKAGLSPCLETLEPITSRPITSKPITPIPFTPIPSAPCVHGLSALQTMQNVNPIAESSSTTWLDKLAEINQQIHSLSSTSTFARVTKIAILDTGYDCNAAFFQNGARQRQIKDWRDFVGNSPRPVDNTGHGTHTLALAMKVSPLAEFYVARIECDKDRLRDSAVSIQNAINWATDSCGADIISMSFGFDDEIPDIGRAIRGAELRRDSEIIFFAAASNSGGNSFEKFPANHGSVISVRETNSNGAFSDTNPPVDPHGPIVFGTLGKDVPSAWLSHVNSEVPKSGSSVATAAASGIAGMMLTLASVGLTKRALSNKANALWTQQGMIRLLRKMSRDMGNRSFFISPIAFFGNKDEGSLWNALADVSNDSNRSSY